MGQACPNPGTVVLEPKSCLMTLHKVTIKQWQDAVDSFFRNYANIVRVSRLHIIEILEDLALKREAIHDILTLLQLPTKGNNEEDQASNGGNGGADGWSSGASNSNPEDGRSTPGGYDDDTMMNVEGVSSQDEEHHGGESADGFRAEGGSLRAEEESECESEEKVKADDVDTNEFFFSLMMFSQGTLHEKVAVFVKRYDACNMRWINSTGVLLILLAIVRGLYKLTTLIPPSYIKLQEFAFQKERWMTSDIIEAIEKDEGAKKYLDALADLHTVEDARITARRLAKNLKRESDKNESKLQQGQRSAVGSSPRAPGSPAQTREEKAPGEQLHINPEEDENTIVAPTKIASLLQGITPVLEADDILEAYNYSEKQCVNRRIAFEIKGMQENQKAKYGFYRPINLDDFNLILLQVIPFLALDKRKSGMLPSQYFNFLTEICKDLNPDTHVPESWPPGKLIKLADWLTQQSCREIIRSRVAYTDQARALFDKYDGDGSGFLDQSELAAPIREVIIEIIHPTPDQMPALDELSQKVAMQTMTLIDDDGSGEIEFSEFRKAIGIVHLKMKEVARVLAVSSTVDDAFSTLTEHGGLSLSS